MPKPTRGVRKGRPVFTRVTDELGDRFVRPTAPPRGAPLDDQGAVLARPRPADEPLGAPSPFPLEWLERKPDWLTAGEGVRVAVAEGPDKGRAAGYIRLNGTCYQDATGACILPPEDLDYETFHRGDAEVIDADGNVVETRVGSIILVGGHSAAAHRPTGNAATSSEAMSHLDDPAKQRLVGALAEDEIGLLFLGAATPECTVADARAVNRSDTSGEWWPIYEQDPRGGAEYQGHDLIGIALVTGGAYRKQPSDRFKVREAIAASLGVTGCAVPGALDDDQDCGCDPAGPVLAAPGDVEVDDPPAVPTPPALTMEDVTSAIHNALRDTTPPAPPGPDPDSHPVGLATSIQELQVTVEGMRTAMGEMAARLDDIDQRLIGVQAAVLDSDEITLPEEVAALRGNQEESDRRLEDLERKLGQAAAEANDTSGGTSAVAPTSPAPSAPGVTGPR